MQSAGARLPDRRRRLITPRRLLRRLAELLLIAGPLIALTVALPHLDHHYDTEFLVVGAAFALTGLALWWLSRRPNSGERTLHAGCAIVSVGILALAWLGMRDVGGIHAIFLVLLLGISASVDSGYWSMALLSAQSLGFAVVLATSDDVLNFDKPTQWLVLTLGLAVSLLYHRSVYRELDAGAIRDRAISEEREQQRILHATHLQRLNDELHAANELKSSFVAMASHELRTPLTAIAGFASTMTDRWPSLSDQDKLRFVTIIDEQAERLSRLVRDLLTLSRIEGGRLHADIEPVLLERVVHQTANQLGLEDIQVELDANMVVLADVDYLQQILVNLLDNAVKYGAPPLIIRAITEPGWVQLQVIDAGDGVPEAFVPHIFERFTRGHEPRNHDSGTGLGLSIVEGLAHAHGGEAWYESNEPSGARFCVRLPAE